MTGKLKSTVNTGVSETKLFGIQPGHILRALKLGFFRKLEMLQDSWHISVCSL